MKIRLLKRSIVLLLVMILSLGMVIDTYTNQANEAEVSVKTEEKSAMKQEAEVIRELKEFRTADSTTYLLSDGSRKLEINNSNIRYEKNGEFIDYNPDLKKMGEKDISILRKSSESKEILSENEMADYQYVNIEGDAKHYFPEKLNENTGIFMKKGKYAIQFSPIVKNEKNVIGNTKLNKEKEEILPKTEKEQIEGNEIIYKDKQENIQYKYMSYPSYVKEEIILKKVPERNIFEFVFNLSGMRVETVGPDKSIQIRDENTNAAVAYIDSPNIKDKNGELRYDVVSYEIEKQENGTYLLKVVVDEDYLKSSETEYPVTIDPTVVWMDFHLESATVSSFSGNSSMNLKNGASFEVQYYGINRVPLNNTEYRCYVDTMVNPLSGDMGDFNGSYVQEAGLKIVEYSNLPNNTGTIEIRTPEGTWNPDTITWNNCPQMGSRVWAQFTTKGTKGAGHKVDLTEWAQALADGEINNYGLILKAKEKGTRAYFYGSSLSNLNYMQLSIVYWPYVAQVNHSYDHGYNVRYSQPKYGNTLPAQMIANHQEWVSSVFGQLFGLKITSGRPQLYTSSADECKTRQGLTVNLDTINTICPRGEGHGVKTTRGRYASCTSLRGTHYSFMDLNICNETLCEVLWSGNVYDGKKEGEIDNITNWFMANSILITRERTTEGRNEDEKRTLLHELGHYFGAPDEYCYDATLSRDKDCGAEGCPTHHPERNAGQCIMGISFFGNVTKQDMNILFCKYCTSDVPLGIPYHLKQYNKIK